MRKPVLLIIFLFLISISAVSAEELAFEGWVYNNKSLNLDTTSYKTFISANKNLLILSNKSINLALNTCSTEGVTKFCYNLSEYDSDLGEYKAYVYAYYRQPEITITRTATNNQMNVGEKATFTVTIKNTGDVDAKDVIFSEDFPSNIVITKVKNADAAGRAIYWKGNLAAGKSMTFEYDVTSTGIVNTYLKASVLYFDGFEEKEVFSTEINLKSEQVITVELVTDKEEYGLNEEMLLNLSLENSGDDDVTVKSLSILVPTTIQVTDKSTMEKSELGLVWSGKLEENKTKTFGLGLKSNKTGQSFVIVNLVYEYKDQEYRIENTNKEFSLSNEGVALTTSLSDTETVNSEQELSIWVKLWNKNLYSKIKNIAFSAETEVARLGTTYIDSVGANNTVLLLNTKISVPKSDEEVSFPVAFYVNYSTEDGQAYSGELKKTIVVKPFKQVAITPSVTSVTLEEGEAKAISVELSNPSDKDIELISIEASIPDIFSVKGSTAASASLNNGESIEIISFTVTPGTAEKEEKYEIDLFVDYTVEGSQYSNAGAIEITVVPKKPEVKIEKSFDKSEVYQGEQFGSSYIITNEDDISIYNLTLVTTQDYRLDTLSFFSYFIPKLDPGEKITFDADQLRAKEKGTFSIAESRLEYYNKYSKNFSETSNSPALTFKEARITGPVLMVKITAPEKINAGESFEAEIKLTSLGTEGVYATIDNKIVGIDEEYIIKKEMKYDEPGTYTIEKVFFDYDYLDGKARAFSNTVTVSVIADEPAAETAVSEPPAEPEKKGIIQSVVDWFKSLLGIES